MAGKIVDPFSQLAFRQSLKLQGLVCHIHSVQLTSERSGAADLIILQQISW
jgi:hypothetical protein